MITNFIDIDSHSDSRPVQTAVSREEQVLLRIVISELGADVASSQDDSNSLLCGVYGC